MISTPTPGWPQVWRWARWPFARWWLTPWKHTLFPNTQITLVIYSIATSDVKDRDCCSRRACPTAATRSRHGHCLRGTRPTDPDHWAHLSIKKYCNTSSETATWSACLNIPWIKLIINYAQLTCSDLNCLVMDDSIPWALESGIEKYKFKISSTVFQLCPFFWL